MSEKNLGLQQEGGWSWKEGGWNWELEVGTLLLGNDKNKVIADKVLSYF